MGLAGAQVDSDQYCFEVCDGAIAKAEELSVSPMTT